MKQHHTWGLVTLTLATLATGGSLYAQSIASEKPTSSAKSTPEQTHQMAQRLKLMGERMEKMGKQMQQKSMQMEDQTQVGGMPAKKGCCGKSASDKGMADKAAAPKSMNMDQADKDIKKMDMDMKMMDKDMDMDMDMDKDDM